MNVARKRDKHRATDLADTTDDNVAVELICVASDLDSTQLQLLNDRAIVRNGLLRALVRPVHANT